jgi:hypothetical protein
VDDPLDSSTSYYEYFILTFDGTNLVEGTASTYLKTDLPGGGLATVGFRTKSAQAAAGLLGPGIQSMRAEEMGLESSAISNVAVQEVAQIDEETIANVRRLESLSRAHHTR